MAPEQEPPPAPKFTGGVLQTPDALLRQPEPVAGEDRARTMVQANVVKEVGRRIRQLRLSRPGPKMTQEHLSERARISVSFLSMIERGERSPHLETLASIAEALEVRLADLFLSGEAQNEETLDPLFQPLVEACRKHHLGKRDVDRLVSVVRNMFA
jgi:transcriptional regulator with XRE-family HTH domain